MPVKYLWRPTQKQARFLSCPAFEAGYGGAPGGGKSDAMLIAPLMGLRWEGYKALLLRRKYVDLERSLIMRSHELYRGRGVYDGQNKRWRFPNNCTIEFGHCQTEADIYNYMSAQYSFIGVEQAEQFLENMYLYFFSRIRTTNPQIRPKMRLNFNPGGIGHSWLRDRFWIHEREPDHAYDVSEVLKHPNGKEETFTYQRAFIPATVYDNEHIMNNDRAYLLRLMQLPEPTRTAYLEGRFDLFEGQFFKEWRPKEHTMDAFEIPSHWRRSISFDWGYGGGKTCVLWYAEDPKDQTVYVYRELYISGTIDIDVAKEIDELSAHEAIYCIYYPWDLDNKDPQTGVSMHERMDEVTGRKYYWRIANKNRPNGWMAVRYLLACRQNGARRMKVFTGCKNLIRTIPRQVFDEGRSEDLDTFGEDHAVDALRYFAGTYRSIEQIRAELSKQDVPVDLGGAMMIPQKVDEDGKITPRQFMFKKQEAPMQFSWMNE